MCTLMLAAGGQKILDYLAKIYKMEQRVKDEGERDSDNVPSSPTIYPSSPTSQTASVSVERSDSTSGEGRDRRRLSANKLTRQDESVREGMFWDFVNRGGVSTGIRPPPPPTSPFDLSLIHI